MRRFLFVAIPLILAVGCGSGNSAVGPTSPSTSTAAPPTSPVVSGATIRGSISGTGGPASIRTNRPAAVAGLMVSVLGTSITAPVDASNHFLLEGVPAGDRQLKFSGAGVDAQLPLAAVQTSETIDLTVALTASSATIASQIRSTGGEQEIEGRVESLPPTTPAGSFVINGQTVHTDGSTQFFRGDQPGTFADLAIGLRAHVKARTSGGALVATLVEIQNTNTDIPVEVNGTIQAFSGTPASFQFQIGDRLIKGDAATGFFGNTVFADIKNGREAEVKGQQRDGYVYASRLHVNVPDDGGDQDQSASIEGVLTAKTGLVPTLTLTVGGTTVKTSGDTVVRRRGDTQDLGVLQIGMTLHVEGIRSSDGSIAARMIQISEDAVDGPFDIEGPMGGEHGTCPSIQFVVNGYSIFTDGATTFSPSCTALKPGNKVTVKGTRQSDGRVKAASVEKQ